MGTFITQKLFFLKYNETLPKVETRKRLAIKYEVIFMGEINQRKISWKVGKKSNKKYLVRGTPGGQKS